MLLYQLKRRLGPEDINVLHAQASAWFAENGLIEEAIKHAMTGENSEAAAQLIVKYGFDLLNDVQWPRLKRWLGMLPGEIVEQTPELLVLTSWLHQIYSRYPELESCLNKAEALYNSRKVEEYVVG